MKVGVLITGNTEANFVQLCQWAGSRWEGTALNSLFCFVPLVLLPPLLIRVSKYPHTFISLFHFSSFYPLGVSFLSPSF